MRIVVTGYAGFIGSNLGRMLLKSMGPDDRFLGIDCFTYAANANHFFEVSDDRCSFADVDIRDVLQLEKAIAEFKPDQVYHLAAESHVCKSIEGPRDFATTNFMGTFNLLEALRKIDFKGRLIHVSTDEAFGSLKLDSWQYAKQKPFTEETPLDPRSPYSASKAASDLMVKAYHETYDIDVIVTRCTNNFGPNQHKEKLIPKTINAFLKGESMTLYNQGKHMRDWIFVDDHCKALIHLMKKGQTGEVYCIGSGRVLSNKEVIEFVADAMRETGWNGSTAYRYTEGRPTDDERYEVDSYKLISTGFKFDWESQSGSLLNQLSETVRWYVKNQSMVIAELS